MQTGLEVLLAEGLESLRGRRVGLITNHSAIDRHLHSAIDLLDASDGVNLVALFGPEHGVRGDAQAGVKVEAATDKHSGLPVYSLYGETQHPTLEMLQGLDALLFDIQDIGVRYATYVSTMANALEAASDAGLPFVVLDRPNPLNGNGIEGNLLDPAFASFVGVHPIPIRHGMTAGELARLIAAERGWTEPIVVQMQGWRREHWFDQTKLPWVQPSPNLPTLDSVTLYSGTCMIEGTNVSEGRGTTRPFEYLGAPWLDPFELVEAMEKRGLPGCGYRPAYFTPTFSKHYGAVCGGIQIHVFDREALRPAELGIHLLDAIRSLDSQAFAWRQSSDGGFFVDLLLGSDQPRLMFDQGASAGEITATWDDESDRFADRRKPYLLYS